MFFATLLPMVSTLFTPTTMAIFSMAFQGISTMMQVNQQQESARYEQQRLDLQAQQYEDQAARAVIEANGKELERKKEYLGNVSQNRTAMSSTGVDLNSASFRALMAANKKTMKQDMRNIAISGVENRINSLYAREDALISKKAAAHTTGDTLSTIGKGISRGLSTYNETFGD
jgi:hypothetical protein